MTIYPTHTCFDDALDMLERAVKANQGAFESNELKVVHAVCLTPWGEEYAHAWVESNGTHCWFIGVVSGVRCEFVADLKEFYVEHRVTETTKYTPRQACELNQRYGTYGPWEDRYRALCANGDKKVWSNQS